jgi:hypothetical protein
MGTATGPSVDISSLDQLDPDKPVSVDPNVLALDGTRNNADTSLTNAAPGPCDLDPPGVHRASGKKRPQHSIR